jgi:hypothetical protein
MLYFWRMAQEIRTDDKDNTEKLRAEAAALLAQAQNQLADIQRALSAVGSDAPTRAKLDAAAAHLSAIVSQLSSAVNSRFFPLRGADLISIGSTVQSGEVHAAIAEAATATTHAGASAAAAANVATASAETRHETEALARDVFNQRIFDPYLRFKSPRDEEEYRQREAETKRYIEQQLAKHSPEGDLNAGGGMIGQMLDAHAHGAGDRPDFMPRWNALVEKTERQRAALRAAGQSTEEYDRHVAAGARRFLKDEGHLTGAQIDRLLSGGANPLDVVKPYLENGRASATKAPALSTKGGAEDASLSDAPQTASDVNKIGAKLKAAGVKPSDHAEAEPNHGVSAVQVAATKDGPARGA